MIQCAMEGDGCPYHFETWFHYDCVDISKTRMPELQAPDFDWLCPLCIHNYTAKTYGLKRALELSGYKDYSVQDDMNPEKSYLHDAIEEHNQRYKICIDTYGFSRRGFQDYQKNMENRRMAELNASTEVAKQRVAMEAQHDIIQRRDTGQLRLPAKPS